MDIAERMMSKDALRFYPTVDKIAGVGHRMTQSRAIGDPLLGSGTFLERAMAGAAGLQKGKLPLRAVTPEDLMWNVVDNNWPLFILRGPGRGPVGIAPATSLHGSRAVKIDNQGNTLCMGKLHNGVFKVRNDCYIDNIIFGLPFTEGEGVTEFTVELKLRAKTGQRLTVFAYNQFNTTPFNMIMEVNNF